MKTVRYPGSSCTLGGITVLISRMVFTPHCLKFLSLKPRQWVWPWHDWVVPPSQSPALQRWCFHNPRSLNGSCRYVLTLAADYVDSGTMVNGLNTGHVSPLFISETKWPSYYISLTVWDVDNQERQPSDKMRELLTIFCHTDSHSQLATGCFLPAFQSTNELVFPFVDWNLSSPSSLHNIVIQWLMLCTGQDAIFTSWNSEISSSPLQIFPSTMVGWVHQSGWVGLIEPQSIN